MIRINLLPEEQRPKVKTPLPYMVSGLILFLALAGMGWLWISAQQVMAKQHDQLAKYREDIQQYGDVVQKYNDLQKQRIEFARKIEIIQEIVSDRIIWSKELWRLSKLTPDNVWYTGIAIADRMETSTVTVYDPKKKKDIEKKERIKIPVLEVKGYVIPDKSGRTGISPLLFNAEEDANFAKQFKLRSHEVANIDYSGVPALSFILEFQILQNTPKSGAADAAPGDAAEKSTSAAKPEPAAGKAK